MTFSKYLFNEFISHDSITDLVKLNKKISLQ